MSSSDSPAQAPDRIRLMAQALDLVLDRLPSAIDRSEEMRREAALLIVDQYRLGEHDPDRLSDLALARLCPTGDEPHDDAATSIAPPDGPLAGE
jgi:hypothetical protein